MAVRIGSLPDSAMIATRVGSMRRVVCASPKLLAGHGIPKAPEDVAGLPCVNFEFLSPASSWPFRSNDAKGTTDVPIRPRLSVTTAEAAIWAASEGVGATRVLHYQCADAVARITDDHPGGVQGSAASGSPAAAGRGALPTETRNFLSSLPTASGRGSLRFHDPKAAVGCLQDLASVSANLRCVATSVRPRPVSVSKMCVGNRPESRVNRTSLRAATATSSV